MSGALHSRPVLSALLRAGRTAAVLLVLFGFVHVTLPHLHSGGVDERHCPACQVSRLDGVGVPAEADAGLVPPVESEAPRVSVPLERPRAAAHDAAVPSRGPPPVSPSEPL